jgi:EAL domain-containing protein (putative c-di-GMP-specific phosphodiesterase class I)
VVRTIVSLGRQLGLEVVAEGIETGSQLSQLQALDCSHGQGFYFAKPLSALAAGELFDRSPEPLDGSGQASRHDPRGD